MGLPVHRQSAIQVRAASLTLALLCLFAAGPRARAADAPKERNFYEVLDDIMGDFEYDLKNGNVTGLKDLSIRNVALSENVPPSFKEHLELLITEKIIQDTKTRMIQCLPCKARHTSLNGDQVVITSPDTNPAELSRIAKMSGISNFMDVAFLYQPTGMILSLTITDPESGSIVWSRSYNSETSRAAALRRGVDFSQVDDARKATEYSPKISFRGTFYYLFEPGESGLVGCMGFGLRMVERFDNRKQEVGFEANYLLDSSSLLSAPAATVFDPYYGFNASLLFVYAYNLIGEEENYNKMRGSLLGAIGGMFAPGYLGAIFRIQYEWRMAKHFAVTADLGYRPPSTPYLSGTAQTQISGVEFGIGINVLF